jgi:ubiquitin-conjugating enzyme E2 J1
MSDSPVLFTSNAINMSENEIRRRNVETVSAENADRQQSAITQNRVETMSSSNDLLWSILIASLMTAIILLILRRLFLV